MLLYFQFYAHWLQLLQNQAAKELLDPLEGLVDDETISPNQSHGVYNPLALLLIDGQRNCGLIKASLRIS